MPQYIYIYIYIVASYAYIYIYIYYHFSALVHFQASGVIAIAQLFYYEPIPH